MPNKSQKKLNKQKQAFIKLRECEKEIELGLFRRLDSFLEKTSNDGINYALEYTSFHGKLDLVQKTIRAGADIHSSREAALKMACKNGHIDVVKYLVGIGADISIDNFCPISYAVDGNNTNIVKFLLETALQKYSDKSWLGNILITAIENNNSEMVKLLVDNGADIHIHGDYPVLLATRCGYDHMLPFLVDKNTI